MALEIKVKKLNSKAKIPTFAFDNLDEAGLDFYTDSNVTLLPLEYKTISTGIAIKLPSSTEDYKYYMKIYSKSGISSKMGIECGGGVIDSSYMGEIKIILFNHDSNNTRTFRCGEKVAQGILYKIPKYKIKIVENFNILTTRMENGFGSTGKT